MGPLSAPRCREARSRAAAGRLPDEKHERDDDRRRHDRGREPAQDRQHPVDREAWSPGLEGEHLDRPRDGRRGLELERRQAHQATRLMSSAARYAVGSSGSKTLPSKKVSLPREVEAGTSPAATPSSFAASRQRSSRLTLAISALASTVASNLPQRMSSVINQRS